MLFEPFKLGSLTLKNRLVMPPMVTNYAEKSGEVTERTCVYYEARAAGGVGLVIVEATCIDAPAGRLSHRQLSIDDDRYIPGLQKLARAIKKHGARASIQIHHAGRNTSSEVTGGQLVAPSAVPSPGGETPRELTVTEIRELINRFAQAAARAKKAGFEGIEIHGAHGYLLCQFLSAASNKRQDEYGGDLKNRARMLMETIDAVKKAVGDDSPVWVRINGREYGDENGTTVEEAQETARMCQAAGVAAIHVSVYSYGTDPRHLPPMALREGYLVRFAEAIKKAVTIPVITVGFITPPLAEQILKEGKADLIAVGRGLIADPEFPRKAADGRVGEITPCLLCGTCQGGLQGEDASMNCRANPAAGKERESAVTKADRAKKVAVIGGGPAGMEAAIVAARRGHRVTLFEQEKELGGQLIVAAVPPYKSRLARLNEAMRNQVRAAGVAVKLGAGATAADVQSLAPDAVIVATGVTPLKPDIPGVNGKNVVTAEAILSGTAQAGGTVVVIGGELVGCETAEFLADAGRKVTITRRGPAMAASLEPNIREPLLGRLADKSVTMLTGVRYERITPEGLVINKDGKQQVLSADTIVLAAGSKPRTELLETLKGKVPEVLCIGDCAKPRTLLEALAEGLQAGRTV